MQSEDNSNATNLIINFLDFQQKKISRIHHYLDKVLSPSHEEKNPLTHTHQLLDAMRYVVLNGGKRIRPLLVYATGMSFGINPNHLDAAAASIELIHCYSLVHDDLPAMDNDTLRRGKPTCHIAYDEATAILVGDALQAISFEILACPLHNPLSDADRLKMVTLLAKAAGFQGMVGGQALDMAYTGYLTKNNLDLSSAMKTLCQVHEKKTGALIEIAVQFGLIPASLDKNAITTLTVFAQKLGLLFQVQDDILDMEGTMLTLGKTQGKDIEQNKLTFTNLLGLTHAKHFARQLYDEASTCLKALSLSNSYLQKLIDLFMTRQS